MAQEQGPPPTITDVISSNQSLTVKWDNLVYTTSNDATLLVINTDANSMASILLTAQQILAEEYTINDLVNGSNYALLFSALTTNGDTYNSNTVYGIPSAVPEPPTIVSYSLQSGLTSVSVVATLGYNGGSPITKIVFRILDETTLSCRTQAFDINNSIENPNTYLLNSPAFVSGHDYIISCQALNPAGYSNVSNSIAFKNSYVPETPVLATIQSGSNGSATLDVSGSNDLTAPITAFKVFNNSTILATFPSTISTSNYDVSLNLTGLTNTQSYSLTVKAVNINGDSLASNVSKCVPALKLAFSSAAVTFSGSNQIIANWAVNSASWAGSGFTTVAFYNSTSSLLGSVSVSSNALSASYTLSGSLVAGEEYSVTINGYNIVPQSLYPSSWISPTLTNYEYNADEVSASATYSTVPGPVSNILYTTDIVDPSNNMTGQIQFLWTAAQDNGSPITTYSCQLYTVANGSRTALGSPIVTSATNCLFTGLNVNLYYAVGIIANNAVGAGPVTYLPNTTAYGIAITDAVPPVSDLVGAQTSYDGTNFTGKLSWTYAGPGAGYSNAAFKVYSIVSGVETLLETITYSSSQSDYDYYPVALGSDANITYNYVVKTSAAMSGGNVSTSVGVYVSITTGLAPIISDVNIYNNNGVWRITFKITNNTSSNMIQNSCTSIVMPDPISDISSVNPVFSDYAMSLVPQNGYYVFDRALGYTAISPDYCTIVCANTYGGAVYNSRWGSP